ncbi:MAG: adenylate/guanylate cyclase domain-containing protein [Melioribacteraceae bacterium]|nr:adenylate/guanylate cyclase domain-containing protein [Melioribacteraceae bacterium]MCF8354607.1 adenylate/guanylate cyclase domain-containing protein [Melioribacteraceae bacterium]MCF8396364.1 adenylate/guanylate cyclase domain-containing protein [Melioribacteraceae bacterium]MCF8420184.1 adenylate/guanylate cyclase domain-containing protein [Melioribacteraceae bacterium]
MNFPPGKYHKPVMETRCFMCLVIKSTSGIAEKLQYDKYYEFINNFFSDIAKPISDSNGGVYKFTNEELIVSWKVTENRIPIDCLNCFFDIKDVINNKLERYKEKFGVYPEFTAGYHMGKVIAGKIGFDKKEIVFSGDALKHTRSILNECKKYNTEILISEDLINLTNIPREFNISEIGSIMLRGLNRALKIFTLDKNPN